MIHNIKKDYDAGGDYDTEYRRYQNKLDEIRKKHKEQRESDKEEETEETKPQKKKKEDLSGQIIRGRMGI